MQRKFTREESIIFDRDKFEKARSQAQPLDRDQKEVKNFFIFRSTEGAD